MGKVIQEKVESGITAETFNFESLPEVGSKLTLDRPPSPPNLVELKLRKITLTVV